MFAIARRLRSAGAQEIGFGDTTGMANPVQVREFFARAARSYLNQLAAQSLTEQIDEALRNAGDDSGTAAVAAGRRYLAGQDDW